MEQSIEIRRMTVSDVEVVTGIYRDILDETYISFSELSEGKATEPGRLTARAPIIFREQLVSNISREKLGFFVAVMGDNIVGFVLASLHQAEAEHTECWIDDLGVRHAWRRHGVGTILTRRALDWGTNEGAKYFLVESGVQNHSAHDLLEHLGFKPLSIVLWHTGAER